MGIALSNFDVFPALKASDAAKVKSKREILEKNSTSSLKDECFNDFRAAESLTSKQKKQLKDWDFVLERSREAINIHLERRVSQLLVQAIVCYNTGYRFEIGDVLHQGYHAQNIVAGDKKKINIYLMPLIMLLFQFCITLLMEKRSLSISIDRAFMTKAMQQ